MEDMINKIKEAFEEYESDELIEMVQEALDSGGDPLTIIQALSQSIEVIGEMFSQGEAFLPDMVMAGEQMEECMEIIKPALTAQNEEVPIQAKVVLGTVTGDIHDIGKNMIKTMLTVSGFDVVDMGTDVSAAQFYQAVVEQKPQFLALSSCMTTTVPNMKDTIDLLTSKGLREKTQIVVGGGSVSAARAEAFGCTYGGENAFECAQIIKRLVAEGGC